MEFDDGLWSNRIAYPVKLEADCVWPYGSCSITYKYAIWSHGSYFLRSSSSASATNFLNSSLSSSTNVVFDGVAGGDGGGVSPAGGMNLLSNRRIIQLRIHLGTYSRNRLQSTCECFPSRKMSRPTPISADSPPNSMAVNGWIQGYYWFFDHKLNVHCATNRK